MPRSIDLLEAFADLVTALDRAPDEAEALALIQRAIEQHDAPDAASPESTLWQSFLREHTERIARGRSVALLQFAHAHADDSPVTRAAEQWLARGTWERPWLRRTNRPETLEILAASENTLGGSQAGDENAIVWMGFDEKSDKLASVTRGGRVRVMETEFGDVQRTVNTGLRGVYSAGLRPDARALYFLDGNHSVIEVNLRTATYLYLLESSTTRAAAISPDGNYAALYLADRSLHVWDLYNTEHMAILYDADVAVVCAALEHRVIMVSPAGEVSVIDARHGTLIRAASLGREVTPGARVYSNGRIVCLAGNDGEVTSLDMETGETLRLPGAHRGALTDVQRHPDNPYLVTAGDDGALRVWDPESGEAMARWESANPITAAALGTAGRIALGDAAGRVLMFR